MIVDIILLVFFVWILKKYFEKPSDYPPGPWGFPVLGRLPLKISKFEDTVEELRKKHGDIFSMKIGARVLIFLCEHKLIKEALLNPAFANRPDIEAFLGLNLEGHKYGVVATNGFHWHEIRRFMLRHLRDLGMGKSSLVSAIHYEAMEVVQVMKKQADTATPLPKAIYPAVINVLWHMVGSKRYEMDDKEILEFMKLIKDLEHSMSGMIVVDIFPWLRSIIPKTILDKLSNKTKLIEISDLFETKFKREVDEHIKTLDSNNCRDFIDDYLIEMEKQKNNPDSVMSYDDLCGCLIDLFGAGLETTSTTLGWAILYLAKIPEVQKNLHKEIDRVLPNGTPATLQDKTRLPYLEAFINETLRFSTLAPVSGFHTVLTDTKLATYTIPKDSIIMPMSGIFNFDPNYFDSPKEFRPERFLDSEGKFKIRTDGFAPFGTGKRQCLGESLARMEIFIFLATFLQHLEFSSPENKEIDIRPDDVPLFHQPKPTEKVVINIRKVVS